MATGTTTLVTQNITNTGNTDVGDYVSTTTAVLYIPAQAVGFICSGLKPNTRISVFFDGINVTSNCNPATYDTSVNQLQNSNFHVTSATNVLTTDGTGTLVGVFNVPSGKFQIGTREFHVFDYVSNNDTYAERSVDYNCQAFSYFSCFNYSSDNGSNPSTISTIPNGSTSTTTTTTRGTGTSTSANSSASRSEPMAQTIYIGSDLTNGADGVYVTGIDLFFYSASQTQPITIDLRTTDSGLPSTTVLSYSQVTMAAANVAVSNNGQTATRFTFSSPVYLRSGYSYALTVTPGGGDPGYLLWSGVSGQTDPVNGIVTSDWGQGSLFTPTNGSTWTPINTEALKFNIYGYSSSSFSESGTAIFNNKDYEFLTYSNTSNIPFIVGEYVYQMPHPFGGFVSCNTTSNVINYNSNTSYINNYSLSNDFAIGDSILLVGSIPGANTSNNVLNWGIFSNVFTAVVSTVNATSIQFSYSNGATANGAPFANSSAAFFKPAKGTVSITAGSNVVVGTGTRFDTQFNTNYQDGTIKIPLVVQWSNGSFDGHEVLWPLNIVNSTYMTVRNSPLTTNSIAIPLNVPAGRIVSTDSNRNLIILDTSTANSQSSNTAWQNVFSTPSYFAVSRVLVGSQSDATALICGVVNIDASQVQPIIYQTAVQGTSLSFTANTTSYHYSDVDYPILSTSGTNYLSNNRIIVASKTNEINYNNSLKSISLNAQLSTNTGGLSPSIDVSQLSMLVGTNIISPDASGEYTNYGSARAKSVSKIISLGDGNDAEDLQIYLTAYRPANTDVQVYVKLLNSGDTDTFSNKYWTQMTMGSNSNLYSDSSNLSDYKAYQFNLPTAPNAVPFPDLVTTNNSVTITSTNGNTTWQNQFSTGQFIVVYSDSSSNPSSYEMHQIANVVSNTQLQFATPISMGNTSSAIIGSAMTPYAGYLNPFNSNIVRYYKSDGSAYDTFNQYAIKIVFLSNNPDLPPKVQSIQAIALSV